MRDREWKADARARESAAKALLELSEGSSPTTVGEAAPTPKRKSY